LTAVLFRELARFKSDFFIDTGFSRLRAILLTGNDNSCLEMSSGIVIDKPIEVAWPHADGATQPHHHQPLFTNVPPHLADAQATAFSGL
jgi:hypothetical protein